MDIKKVGVVGCGTMGAGIAQVAAQSGYNVVVSEANDALLQKGMNALNNFLTKTVERGKMTKEQKGSIVSLIKGTTKMEDFSDCDIVIEAIIERMDLKKDIFSRLDKICPEQTILASNTSCLSIIDMAVVTGRADKVLGLHFFNPVPLMKLVEVVKTIATSADTLNAGKEFAARLGKTTVIAQDNPGFIVNRLLVPFLLNAIHMLENGVATREDIDAGINLGLNHPMGPLALSDLVGLDTLHFIASSIYEELKDPQYVSPPLLKKMVTAGWLGRKTGKGFFDYK